MLQQVEEFDVDFPWMRMPSIGIVQAGVDMRLSK